MIQGTGIDIESVQKFREMQKDINFLKLIFTEKEISYCNKKREPHICFTGKFCAKEATIKAYPNKIAMNDIEIINQKSGKIEVFIKGKRNRRIYCCISHTEDYATAMVIIEQ